MSITQTISFIWNHPLSRGRRAANLTRFARWQVKSRVFEGPHLEPFVGGARLSVRRGQTRATGNLYVGLHELEDMAFALHLLRPGDLFFDIGANVGSYTVLAAKVVGALVVAVEPVPATFEALLANVQVNAIGALVDARNCGLAAEPGVLSFTRGQDTTNHVAAMAEAESTACVSVPVTTFDALAAGGCPLLAKIDVEGYETQVLAGAGESLANPALRGLILELNGSGERYGQSDAAVFSAITEAGFAPYRYEPFSRRLEPLEGPNRDGGNTLFLRDLPFVEGRVKGAAAVDVRGVAV